VAATEAPPHRLVTDDTELDTVVGQLLGVERYAIDTEFHRERTYFPRLALVQIAWDDDLVLIDPLAVDVGRLGPVFATEATAVMHAAGQDIEVLDHACGAAPRSILDTQILAGFLGMSSPSLANLHKSILDLDLPKANRLSDWLERPLRAAQLDYAASDVAHLLTLCDRLVAELEARDRLAWALDENRLAVERSRERREPLDAWRRVKEIRQLRGAALAAAQEVAAWREERAARIDIPVRHVLSDIGLVGLAQRRPTDRSATEGIRGFDPRQLKAAELESLLERIGTAARRTPRQAPGSRAPRLPSERKAVVPLVSAWITQIARDLEIDPTLLATRADIEGLLAGDPEARLASGWREEVVGDGVRRLLDGEAALAFDSDRGLVLEDRAAHPGAGSPRGE
jgi:ribonuclease D